MSNPLKAVLIALLWIAAALVTLWAVEARASDDWRYDCGAYQLRFGQNSLTINDREVYTLLNSSPAAGVRPDGSEYAAVAYEFETGIYLVVAERRGNAVLVIPAEGEQAIWCEGR